MFTNRLLFYSYTFRCYEALLLEGLSVRPSDRPSVRPSDRPSVRLSVRPFVRPTVSPSVPPSVCPFVCPLRVFIHARFGAPYVVYPTLLNMHLEDIYSIRRFLGDFYITRSVI